METLISPATASQLICESIDSLPPETIPADQAYGRIIRQNLVADRPFPPFDRIMMDGIAARHSEILAGSLKLAGIHAAGNACPSALPPQHCWQVMTGSILPTDCDTVVPVEELDFTENSVALKSNSESPIAGRFIHRRGSDSPAGAILLESGAHLGPAELGLAATVGATRLQVTRQPRIRLFSTGDELISPSQTPLPHQLRQSNQQTLAAAIRNYDPKHNHLIQQHLPDEKLLLHDALQSALQESDLILLTGGISKGTRDLVRPCLEELIGAPTFHGIFQKPGKPLAYWAPTSQSPPVLALPGNPNSTLDTYYRYARLALARLRGSTLPQPIHLPLAQPGPSAHPKLTLFLPATLQSNGEALAHTMQNSGDLPAALGATGLIELEPDNSQNPPRTCQYWSFADC